MEKESILSHWILPKNGLNQRTPFCNHPPGNSPELMPMDDSLNKDWADGLKRHQLFTMNLPEDDPKKFSSSTPKRLSSSMRRVWEGCPSSERIAQDVRKVIYDNIPVVQKHGGVIVPGVGNRVGKRNVTTIKKSPNWGGCRVKKTLADLKLLRIHPNAIDVRKEIITKAVAIKEEHNMKLELVKKENRSVKNKKEFAKTEVNHKKMKKCEVAKK